MARKADHSREETKNAIIDAFLELYKVEPLEKITINAITKMAQVNRGTFYYYYQDIYELLEELEESYLENVEKALSLLVSGVFDNNLLDKLNAILQFYDKYKELLLLFIVQKPNKKVIEATKKIAISYALNLIGESSQNLTVEQECIITYIAHAQFGIIIYWLENGHKLSLDQLAQIMLRVNKEGPITVLLEDKIQYLGYVT